MNTTEIKRAVLEAMIEARSNNGTQIPVTHKHKMEFSKCILIFASVICAGTWVIAVVSWLLWREFPAELVQYTGWFFGAVAAYMGKSAYENKPKIMNGQDGDIK